MLSIAVFIPIFQYSTLFCSIQPYFAIFSPYCSIQPYFAIFSPILQHSARFSRVLCNIFISYLEVPAILFRVRFDYFFASYSYRSTSVFLFFLVPVLLLACLQPNILSCLSIKSCTNWGREFKIDSSDVKTNPLELNRVQANQQNKLCSQQMQTFKCFSLFKIIFRMLAKVFKHSWPSLTTLKGVYHGIFIIIFVIKQSDAGR